MSKNVSPKNRVAVENRVNKAELVEKLQSRYRNELNVDVSESTLTNMFNIMMDEVQTQLKRGRGIHLAGFGLFYPKKLKATTVQNNLGDYNGDFFAPDAYKVPARTKLGFTSFRSSDAKVSRKRATR